MDEAYALELLRLSRFETHKLGDRALWVAKMFTRRYPEASYNKVYSWALETLRTWTYVPFNITKGNKNG